MIIKFNSNKDTYKYASVYTLHTHSRYFLNNSNITKKEEKENKNTKNEL